MIFNCLFFFYANQGPNPGGPKGGGLKGGAPKGGASKVGAPKGGARRVGPRRVGPRRVGAQTQKKWGPEGWGPEGWGPEGWEPEGWAPEGGGPKISSFFPSPATKFVLFFPLWASSRGILVVFEAPGPELCEFGVLWLSCASPGGPVWWGRRGFTRQPELPKRAHLRVPAFKNTSKIQREDTQRGKKRTNFVAGEGKKRAKFWAVEGKGGPGEGRSRGRAVPRRAVQTKP